VEPAPALLIMVNKTLNYWGPGFEEDVININVGGLRRRLSSSALSKFPDTRLGRLLSCDSEESILQLCDDYDEIEYWGINEFFLDSCCSYRYQERKLESRHHNWDEESEVSSVDTSPDEISDINHDLLRYSTLRCGNVRKRLWLTMENPGYSIPSKLFSFVSISVVLVSIATMCIHSMPEYQQLDENGNMLDEPVLHKLEYFCISWFTFEVSSRLLLSPNPRKFFKHPLNLIDIVSVLPFYFTLLVDLTMGSDSELGNLGKVVQVFRLMRIFRVLKLARHSTGLRSLGATLKVNWLSISLSTPIVPGVNNALQQSEHCRAHLHVVKQQRRWGSRQRSGGGAADSPSDVLENCLRPDPGSVGFEEGLPARLLFLPAVRDTRDRYGSVPGAGWVPGSHGLS
ncbi:PREDICTED: potassium voltage-gated channel subfamily S member 1-like, partial [Chlamydotis macqueenii]|uniref:potassium voltage-gated channel subfamily S member 1-like n=1 Tax=Chlamydotis macqueenii TaxID=187382 RepID=UPI000529CDF2